MVRYKNRYGVFCVRFVEKDDEKKHVVLSGRDVYYAIQVRIVIFFRFVFVLVTSLERQNSLSVNYGDYGLGAALPSLQGKYNCVQMFR